MNWRIGVRIGSRLGVTCIVAGMILVGVLDHDLFTSLLLALMIVAWPLWLFATESETLPAECPIPRRRWMAVLVAPWLPGGGRGALFLSLHLFFVSAAMLCLNTSAAPVRTVQIGIFCLFGVIDVLLPCAIWRNRLRDSKGRALVRIASVGLLFGGVTLGSIITDSTHYTGRALVEQVVSPWRMFQMITHDGRFVGHPVAPLILLGLLVAAVFGNAVRVRRGVTEVVERNALEHRAVRTEVQS